MPFPPAEVLPAYKAYPCLPGKACPHLLRSYIPSSYINLAPLGTGISTVASTISPFSSAKPVTRHSDIKLAICFFGILTTARTCLPISSSFIYLFVLSAPYHLTPPAPTRSLHCLYSFIL